jgi:hypothetical protein
MAGAICGGHREGVIMTVKFFGAPARAHGTIAPNAASEHGKPFAAIGEESAAAVSSGGPSPAS